MTETRTQSGFALYAALLAVVVIGSVVTALTQSSRRGVGEQRLEEFRAVSLAAADGGVELARAAIARNRAYAGELRVIGAADVTIEVETLDAEPAQRWRVRSTAISLPSGPHGLPVVRCIEAELHGRAGLPAVVTWRAR